MSWYYNVNQKMITSGTALYQLMLDLIAVGWTVKGSGDGTGGNYSSSGNIITSGLHQAFGLLNVGSWFRIQSPTIPSTGQKREFVFQQGNSSGTISTRITYSPNPTGSTGFTGGSPSASRVPTATDEVIVFGGGTDASPTYSTWGNSDYQFALHVVANYDGIDGYSWYVLQTTVASNNPSGFCMALDVMRAGTTASNDTDPCVVYCSGGSLSGFGADLRNTDGIVSGFVGGTASSNWVPIVLITNTTGFPNLLGSDAWNNEDTCVIPQWISTSVPYATKGYSSLFMYNGQPRGTMYLLQTDPNANGNKIYISGTLLPWPSNTPIFIP